MKYVVQKNTYEEQKLHVVPVSPKDIRQDESLQVIVLEEHEFQYVKGFFKLLQLDYKLVIPPAGSYVYPIVLSENDGETLISYEDFIRSADNIPVPPEDDEL